MSFPNCSSFGFFGNATCLMTQYVQQLISNRLLKRLSTISRTSASTNSFALVLLRKSFFAISHALNCSSSNRFILMILKRLFKLLPSSHDVVSQIVIRIDPALIDYWNQYRPRHPNLRQFIYTTNMMLVPCLRGDISLSFPQITNALFVIGSHMHIALERMVIILLDHESQEERRDYNPHEVADIDAAYCARDALLKFLHRIDSFMQFFYFSIRRQIQSSFSRLR